jgi:chromosome segregation ATPase
MNDSRKVIHEMRAAKESLQSSLTSTVQKLEASIQKSETLMEALSEEQKLRQLAELHVGQLQIQQEKECQVAATLREENEMLKDQLASTTAELEGVEAGLKQAYHDVRDYKAKIRQLEALANDETSQRRKLEEVQEQQLSKMSQKDQELADLNGRFQSSLEQLEQQLLVKTQDLAGAETKPAELVSENKIIETKLSNVRLEKQGLVDLMNRLKEDATNQVALTTHASKQRVEEVEHNLKALQDSISQKRLQ